MRVEGCKESSEAWPLPLEGYYLIYGDAGAGKSVLSSFFLSKKCTDKSVYISTEGELPFLNLKCEKTKTITVTDYRQALYVIMRSFDQDVVVLDSISMITRLMPPSIGSKISMAISWLMSKRRGFSIVVSQMSAKDGRAPFHEFLEPWADYIIKVERVGSLRRAIIEWSEKEREEIYFIIRGGDVVWMKC